MSEHGGDNPDAAILAEVPDDVGLVLWQYFRHLRDWQKVHADARAGLLPAQTPAWVLAKRAEAFRIEPTLAALCTLDRWLRAPSSQDDAIRASACEEIAQWAATHGYGRTAVLYAEMAAQIEPDDPRREILVGKLARGIGEMARAEQWFNSSIASARKQGRWEEYIRAHLGLGILYMLTRKDHRARKHLGRASATAARKGYEWLAAQAQHDLFQFMTVRGHFEEAEMHARMALLWYPKNNARIPYLLADVAFLLICRGGYGLSIQLLRRFLRLVPVPQNVLGQSMLARAYACTGAERWFHTTRRRLVRLLENPECRPFRAAALWNLAEAERALAHWSEATFHASRALELALAEQDLETAQFARATLSHVQDRAPVEPESAAHDASLLDLVTLLLDRIDQWSPTRRGRPRGRSPEDWAA